MVPGAGSADSLPGQSAHPDGVGGVWPDREAATAGHWSAEPELMDAGEWDEAPAVGGDCADTPAGEAAAAAAAGSPVDGRGSVTPRINQSRTGNQQHRGIALTPQRWRLSLTLQLAS